MESFDVIVCGGGAAGVGAAVGAAQDAHLASEAGPPAAADWPHRSCGSSHYMSR